MTERLSKKALILEGVGLNLTDHSLKTKNQLTAHESMQITKIAHKYWASCRNEIKRDSFDVKLAKYNDGKYLVDAILSFIVKHPIQ